MTKTAQSLGRGDLPPPQIEDLACVNALATVRTRAGNVFAAAEAGDTRALGLDLSRLPALADQLAEQINDAWEQPAHIPCYSQWRLLEAGQGVDRLSELEGKLFGTPSANAARILFEMTVLSVLLGGLHPGADWRYAEAASGQKFGGHEGMAIAVFRMFLGGDFSAYRQVPLSADALALEALPQPYLDKGLQSEGDTPPEGMDQRLKLLNRLGQLMMARGDIFGDTDCRIGHLYDRLVDQRKPSTAIPLGEVMALLQSVFGPLLEGAHSLHGVPLGDVAIHPHAGGSGETAGLLPFHQDLQWLVWSLIDPLHWAGWPVTDRERLTALPDHHLASLFRKAGVLIPKDMQAAEAKAETRALVLVLMDHLHPLVAEKLSLDLADFPLASLLESCRAGASTVALSSEA